MTLAELRSFDMAAAWSRLTPEAQARIGVGVIGWMLADLVAEDDGSETTEADRNEAAGLLLHRFNAFHGLFEAEFPEIAWYAVA